MDTRTPVSQSSYKILSSNALKNIAIVAMFFDHFFAVFLPANTWLWSLSRVPGRVVAPIMCYLIAQGFIHSSNLRKYGSRLLLFTLISHLPYVLYFKEHVWQKTSVMWSLFLGLVALTVAKRTAWALPLKVLAIGGLCLLAIPADWQFVAVLWILSFGLFAGRPSLQFLSFSLIGIFCHILPALLSGSPYYIYEIGIFLALPLLSLYNGKQGKKSKLIKWGFYVFYPLHLLLFYAIRLITGI